MWETNNDERLAERSTEVARSDEALGVPSGSRP